MKQELYNSIRAKKSRLMSRIKPMQKMLVVLRYIFLISGFVLVFFDNAAGWIILALWVCCLVITDWWSGELHRLQPNTSGNRAEDWLASNILGKMSPTITPEGLAKIIMESSGGIFIASRFGLGKTTIQSLSSIPQNSIENIFSTAMEIHKKLGTKTVSGSVLALAIIKNYPEYEKLLAQFYAEFEDLEKGVEWHDHLYSLVDKIKQPRKTGGIARDWSFGWTPMLDRFGFNISNQMSSNILMSSNLEQNHEIVENMIQLFSSGARQNIALIGADGVGKTTIVKAFANKIIDGDAKIPSNLKYRQVILLDSSSLLGAAPGRGEVENLINQILVEAYLAKNVILCLDNAQLFFEEGAGSVDISNLLLPILQAGKVRMILTMDEQRFLEISSKKPALAAAMNRIQVKPAEYNETLASMEDNIILFEYTQKVFYRFQAMKEAYSLGKRYIYDLEMPGRAIKLLENSAHYAINGVVEAESVQNCIESTMNVKVSTSRAGEEKDTLLNLESLLHQRMIGQEKAVSAVANALRRARTGVRNQNRPIGTFLFLGPTGVGKTELAKALADTYFNGENNIIRLDLNEYVGLDDVSRLIADGARDANSLTAQVMKKPFSVVLLDEIEKAHPNVLTALLQVLDEGILRDEKNREVSFRDAVIIATSNAGSERIQELIARGYNAESAEGIILQDLISSREFKPEFLNRFDEIVIFEPLSKDDLSKIIDLMVGSVNKTLSAQKIGVVLTPEAKAILSELGYNPQLGARPMRRVIQKVVENTIARKMLSGEATPGSTIVITPEIVQDNYK